MTTKVKSRERTAAEAASADRLDPLRAETAELAPRAEANAERIITAAREFCDAVDEHDSIVNTSLDIASRAYGPKRAYGQVPRLAGLSELRRALVRGVLMGDGLDLPLPRDLTE